ncbi:MAG TPA: lipoprotein insertase outer membrane protein LolB [Burkholderiales bacterium]|nr:lipoprotein insertase outer membrane protein LolB [Burkholderiales bacterium]
MIRIAVALPLAMLLCACAVAPRVPVPESVDAIRDFEVAGRVAVRIDDRGYSANLRWRHRDGGDALWLYSPVGSVVAMLTADASGATLVTSEKKSYRSADVQELTREVLGWDLPLQGLQYWVLGRPDPAAPVMAQERDARDRLRRLTQGDWKISYLNYAGDGPLPTAMALEYDRLRLRLVIDRWQIVDVR